MEYVLSLKTLARNKHRLYFMSCESEETMNEWVRNLIFACNLVARNGEWRGGFKPLEATP